MAAIDTVVEEVADNLEELSQATRRINTRSAGIFIGGCAVGLVVGFYLGHRWNKEKIKAEAFKESEEEVARMREYYQQKVLVAEPKPSVEEVIEEKGYERPLKPPVPGLVDPTPVTPPPVVIYEGGKDKAEGWNYEEELDKRINSQTPYIIHQDEFNANETGYDKVTYTYYAGDDVMVDEENGHPLPHGDLVVGVENLRFGHGTDDIDVVYVRNNDLKLEMEICRSHESYEEKFLGIHREHDDDDDDESD